MGQTKVSGHELVLTSDRGEAWVSGCSCGWRHTRDLPRGGYERVRHDLRDTAVRAHRAHVDEVAASIPEIRESSPMTPHEQALVATHAQHHGDHPDCPRCIAEDPLLGIH